MIDDNRTMKHENFINKIGISSIIIIIILLLLIIGISIYYLEKLEKDYNNLLEDNCECLDKCPPNTEMYEGNCHHNQFIRCDKKIGTGNIFSCSDYVDINWDCQRYQCNGSLRRRI